MAIGGCEWQERFADRGQCRHRQCLRTGLPTQSYRARPTRNSKRTSACLCSSLVHCAREPREGTVRGGASARALSTVPYPSEQVVLPQAGHVEGLPIAHHHLATASFDVAHQVLDIDRMAAVDAHEIRAIER